MERQDAAIEEYLDHNAMVPVEIQTLYGLFDGFIAACLAGRREQRILDVGCGIRSDWPHYARSVLQGQSDSGNAYVGLDPLNYNLATREYPFVAGRLEDLPGTFSVPFDVFLFSTSLDHFRDLEKVAQIVSDLASKHALCIFWIGLHDQTMVAEQVGAHIFRKLFASLHPLRFLWHYIEAVLKIPLRYLWLLKRRAQLLAGKSLDDMHFHYFTERNLHPILASFGKIERYLHVPGTNSVFICVRHD